MMYNWFYAVRPDAISALHAIDYPNLEGTLIFLLHWVLVSSRETRQSVWAQAFSSWWSPSKQLSCLAYAGMTCSIALLFLFALRWAVGLRSKSSQWVVKGARFWLPRSLTHLRLHCLSLYEPHTGPWLSVTPPVRSRKISGVRAEGNDSKKCHLCLVCAGYRQAQELGFK